MLRTSTNLLCLILILSLPLAAADAHDGATGIVKERMDLMSEIARATKRLTAMFKGRQPYDADTVRAAAETIAGLGGPAMTGKFPAGSLDRPSEALPEVWRDWGRFERLASAMQMEASRVAQLARNGPTGFGSLEAGGETSSSPAGPAATRLLSTCKACHEKFRKRN